MEGSGAIVFQVPLTGHAPTLLDPLQIEAVQSFLTG
jgi:hypothetical protein